MISRGKHLPNFTDEEVYHWFGNRGVYSSSVEQFKSCFEVFEHRNGIFRYRLKPREDWLKLQLVDGLISAVVVLHDPMETLFCWEYGEEINCIVTHYLQGEEVGEEIDEIENM